MHSFYLFSEYLKRKFRNKVHFDELSDLFAVVEPAETTKHK